MKSPPDMLSDCTDEAGQFIAQRTSAVTEIGAGFGWFAHRLRCHGVTVRALDIRPMGANIEQGSHEDVAPGSDVLIAWPPERLDVYEWVKDIRPSLLFIVGQASRMNTTALAERYEIEDALAIPGGRKGVSMLTAWRLRQPQAA